MGKRNKTQSKEDPSKTKKTEEQVDIEINSQNNEEIETKIHKKKRRKGSKVDDANIAVTDELNDVERTDHNNPAEDKKTKYKKLKVTQELELNPQSNDAIEPRQSKKKRSKGPNQDGANVALNNSKKDGKKIIFVDDKPQEVPAKSGSTNSETKKKFFNEDEADVKDEDIDKFCDELGDDDNAQYEEWVKLVEAQLHSNKKKT